MSELLPWPPPPEPRSAEEQVPLLQAHIARMAEELAAAKRDAFDWKTQAIRNDEVRTRALELNSTTAAALVRAEADRDALAAECAALGARNLATSYDRDAQADALRARALAAERSQDEARAEARAAHTPVCNYSHGPMFGPGCICVVTYKAQVAEWKAAETERDEARRELGAEQIAHAEAVVERDEAREALREAVALTAWAMVRGVMVTLSPGDHVALREWRERVLSGEKEGA